jgi:anti-sigma factor (TIGR02949 family)
MKLISFEDKSCERYRKHLDVYLSNELMGETSLDVFKHLERCPRCTEELETKQRVKNELKRAMDRQEPAPVDLQQRILKEIRPRSRPKYWWLPVAATIVLSVGAFSALRWMNTRHASNGVIKLGGSELISTNNAEMLNIGVGDHIHCALHRDFSAGPRSFERMSQDLGPEYIGLVPSVKERLPQDHTLMVGHRCDFKGRNFVHLILTNQKTILSVILTEKNGERFDRSALAAVMQASGSPLYRARLQDQEVVGFETRDYLAYVVSGLPQDEHLQLASSLALSVRNFLGRLEG